MNFKIAGLDFACENARFEGAGVRALDETALSSTVCSVGLMNESATNVVMRSPEKKLVVDEAPQPPGDERTTVASFIHLAVLNE